MGIKLLFLNSLKGLKNKKIQFISIVLLVMLSTAIYTSLNSSLDRLEDNYYKYLNDNAVENFSFVPKVDYKTSFKVDEIIVLENTIFKDVSLEIKQLLTLYKMCLTNTNSCPNDEIYTNIEQLFNYYGIRPKNTDYQTLANYLEEKYDITIEYQKSKTLTENKKVYKIIPYYDYQKINKPYLIEGKSPINNNEITLLPGFMKQNNLNIGDKYTINNHEYTITGIASSPNYIFPILSISTPFYQEKNHTVLYLNEETYKEIAGLEESSFVARSNNFTNSKDLEFKSMVEIFKQEEDKISYDLFEALRLIRINQLSMEISTNRIFSEYFLVLLLVVASIITLMITKKRIEEEKKQIGVLKSLGYTSFKITISYLIYPLFGGIIGGLLGYIIGILLNPMLTSLYASFYVLPLSSFNIDISYLLFDILVPTISLVIISFIIIMFMLRHKALNLLKEGSNLKVNLLTKIVTKLTSKMSFKNKFKYSLASRSISKLLLIILVSFSTGLLIVLTLIGFGMFDDMIEKNFNGINFKYMVAYKEDIMYQEQTEDAYILERILKVTKIVDEDGIEKEIKRKDTDITINAMDVNTNKFSIYDKDKNEILKLLKNNEAIINQNVADILGLKINDIISFDHYGTTINYQVKYIQDSYFGFYIYVDRQDFIKQTSLNNVYNKIFTNNTNYENLINISGDEKNNISNVINLEDLNNNIKSMMDGSNATIYLVIFFAAVMAFIIIIVIANIVVEENKKTISIMKVLGYQDNNISKIVLNIYTPFIIVAYLLSIPAMISLLKYIVSLLAKDMDYSLPITISYTKALLGLVVLLISYYIAIYIARQKLNKVALSEALKRE